MIYIIVACDPHRVIGTAANTIPWHIPADMKFFKERTTNHIVLMGNNTWKSLKKPLPNRINMVLTRTPTQHDSACFYTNIHDALRVGKAFPTKDIYIIGGSQIYELALKENIVERVLISHIHATYPGTVYFPNISTFGFKPCGIKLQHEDFNVVEYKK